jgi:hypothetical protein
MPEYRVVKGFAEWKPGDRIFPNCVLSEGQRRGLEEQGFIVLASIHKPPKSVPTSSAMAGPIETAAYEEPTLRRRPGRPRKYDSSGKPIADPLNGDQNNYEETHV